jgi:uncharacterized protein
MLKKLIIVLVVLSSGWLLAQEGTRSLSVTGSGTAYGEPDVAIVELGVNIVNEDIAMASTEANQIILEVTNVLLAAGIDTRDIRTAYYNIWRDEGYAPFGGEATTPRYRVNNILSITVRDVNQVGDIIAESLNAGANAVNNVLYTLSDPQALATEARELAFNNARAKAEQLATLAGLELGQVITISDGTSRDPMAHPAAMMDMGSGSVPVSGGQLAISATIIVYFELVEQN